MPLTAVEFASGLVKDEAPLAAEGGYTDANNVRFRQGKPEVRGGCELLSTTQFSGISRKQFAWSDLRGQPQMAFGTADKAYALTGGSIVDITPPYIEGTALNPFTTVSGSSTVTVAITENGLKFGQSVTFSHAAAVGGLTLNGTFTVSRVVTRDKFEITVGGNATSNATGGGGVDFTAPLMPGLTDGLGGLGYGSGGYGTGTFGLPNTTDFLPTAWSMSNFGEVLLLNRRGGALYAWQPALAYPEIMLTSKYVGGTGWSTSATGGTKSAGTAANLSQNIQNAQTGGYTYRLTFTAALTAGTVKVQVNAGTTPAVIDVGSTSTPISQSGTYSRLVVMPANAVDLVFAADAAFAGSVTGISLKLESKAFIIPEAPRSIGLMFVDPHRTVCAFDTYEADGDKNPLLARWSDLENFRSWVPDTTNFAGELAVGSGGRIVCALSSRNANLIWTDVGLHGMAFSPSGFSIALIASGVGALGINAAVEHQGIAYWWSNNGNPYKTTFDFQGTIPQMIDCRLRKDVFDNITPGQAEKMYASINSEFSEVQWFYPDQRDGIECSRAAVYQFAENHWTAWTENRSSWVSASVFVSPIACGTDGYLYYQERGDTNNGNPVQNYLETAYFDIEDGGNLMLVNRFVPDFQRQTGDISVTFVGKLWPNATETMTRTRAAAVGTKKVDFRLKARQIKMRLSATTPWRGGKWRIEGSKAGASR